MEIITQDKREDFLSYIRSIRDKELVGTIDAVDFLHDGHLKIFQEIKKKGGEGLVIKDPNAPYEQGVWKVKNNTPGELMKEARDLWTFKIMGFTPGEGRFTNNGIGAIQYGDNNNIIGKVASGLTDEERRYMFQHPEKFIGKKIIIRGEGQSKSGAILKPIVEDIK